MATAYGGEVLGKRVAVPRVRNDGQPFLLEGFIREIKVTHAVVFDDGVIEWLDLAKAEEMQRFTWIKEGTLEDVASANSSPESCQAPAISRDTGELAHNNSSSKAPKKAKAPDKRGKQRKLDARTLWGTASTKRVGAASTASEKPPPKKKQRSGAKDTSVSTAPKPNVKLNVVTSCGSAPTSSSAKRPVYVNKASAGRRDHQPGRSHNTAQNTEELQENRTLMPAAATSCAKMPIASNKSKEASSNSSDQTVLKHEAVSRSEAAFEIASVAGSKTTNIAVGHSSCQQTSKEKKTPKRRSRYKRILGPDVPITTAATSRSSSSGRSSREKTAPRRPKYKRILGPDIPIKTTSEVIATVQAKDDGSSDNESAAQVPGKACPTRPALLGPSLGAVAVAMGTDSLVTGKPAAQQDNNKKTAPDAVSLQKKQAGPVARHAPDTATNAHGDENEKPDQLVSLPESSNVTREATYVPIIVSEKTRESSMSGKAAFHQQKANTASGTNHAKNSAVEAASVAPERQNGPGADDWIKDLSTWMLTTPHGPTNKVTSKNNTKRIVKQVQKLASGEGIPYVGWGKNVRFYRDRKVNLSFDFDKMLAEAKRFEKRHGGDKGHGWVLTHPIGKMRLFKLSMGAQKHLKALADQNAH